VDLAHFAWGKLDIWRDKGWESWGREKVYKEALLDQRTQAP